jgi:hypothetical protein
VKTTALRFELDDMIVTPACAAGGSPGSERGWRHCYGRSGLIYRILEGRFTRSNRSSLGSRRSCG